MKVTNRLAATTTCYAPYRLEEALAGIAGAGYRYVELAAIRGVIEHVPLVADAPTLGGILRLLNRYALTPVALSAHSNLTTAKGVKDALRALDLCERMGIDIMNTAIGGPGDVEEDEAAFLGNIGRISDYAAERSIAITLEIHGELTATGTPKFPGRSCKAGNAVRAWSGPCDAWPHALAPSRTKRNWPLTTSVGSCGPRQSSAPLVQYSAISTLPLSGRITRLILKNVFRSRGGGQVQRNADAIGVGGDIRAAKFIRGGDFKITGNGVL